MTFSFYKNLVFMSLILIAVLAPLKEFAGYYTQGNLIWFSLGFYILLTIITYHWVLAANKKTYMPFIGRYFMSSLLRIILCGGFLAIYLIIRENRDKVFVLTFMMLYLFFTLFEIYHLVSKLRPEKKRDIDTANH